MRDVVINEPTVVHELIDGEVVAIHNETGAYYSLRESAALVWQALAAGWDREAIVGRLGGERSRAEADLAAFTEQLLEATLVVPGTPDARSEVEVPPTPEAYVPPVFEAFTDLQDLLLLDPIHEVGEAGWPSMPGS